MNTYGDTAEQDLDWILSKISSPRKATKGFAVPATPFVPVVPTASKVTPAKKQAELEMFHTWNNNGRKKKDLDPLLKSFEPMMQGQINRFRRAEVPISTIEMQHKKALVKALETWDVDKGGSLSTWITTNLRKVTRFVDTHKNMARIPENVSKHIGAFNALKSELTDQLGYEPGSQEIHDHLVVNGHPRLGKLSFKQIDRLSKEQRKDLIDKGHESDLGGSSPYASDRDEEVIQLITHQLSKEERAVHELTFGSVFGHERDFKPGEIAKKLKMDGSKVSKLRTSIYKKMEPYRSTR